MLTWLPKRRYVIPSRSLATARGEQATCSGTLLACSDGTFTGWGDVPDAVVRRENGDHSAAAESFAKDIALLHLEAQQHGVSLAAWLHEKFPQWTVPPRTQIEVQALVEFDELQALPQQEALQLLGLSWLKVKLTGAESLDQLAATLRAAREHGWRLRVDVNGAWQGRSDLAALLSLCQSVGVAYVEDAVPVDRLPVLSDVPLAVDAIDSSVRDAMAAALAGHCQTLVVKPPLWGSVAQVLADVARLSNLDIAVALSSSFEGPVGLGHLAQLAAVLPTTQPAGLATHLRWQEAWQPPALQVTAGRWTLPALAPRPSPLPIAVVHARGGQLQPVALGALLRQAHAVAARLSRLGVGPGALVATWAGNTLEALIVWQAVRLLGATWLPLHPRLTSAEVQALLDRTTPAVLLAATNSSRDLILDNCHFIDLFSSDFCQHGSVIPFAPNPATVAALLFTSGSTGAAKGVQLSWRALAAATDAALGQFGAQHGGSWLCCLPVCHVSGLLIQERALRMGMTVLLADQPSTQTLAEMFEQMQPRLASLVPAQLTRLLDEAIAPPRELLAVIVGGAPCPAELVDRARLAGWPVLPSYGMTETAAQVATAPLRTRLDRTPWPRADDAVCVGPPIPGVELRIVEGEILVRSAQLLSGYFDEATPLVDGWLHTGDLGRLDGNGWLWVTGRRGELILRGGENVTPDEVEAVLRTVPGVLEACVVGVADRVLGQRVAAWLTVPTPIADADLQEHLRKLAPFKRPEVWLQTAEPLPRTGPGKIARGQVRVRLWAQRSNR